MQNAYILYHEYLSIILLLPGEHSIFKGFMHIFSY